MISRMVIKQYLDQAPASADHNMAFDEWLLAQAINRPGEVYLRLYAWEVGSITFGVNQRVESALDHTQLEGTPLIRRVTGGRALYHDRSELTYSIAFNTAEPPCEKLSGSVAQSSIAIAEALRLFLDQLGLSSEWVRKSAAENSEPAFFHKAPCFASAAKYELMQGDQKLVASAQRRFRTGVMQHGSIKLRGVVAHPALGRLGDLNSKPQAVDKKELNKYAQLFGELFASYLGGRTERAILTDLERSDIGTYAAWVRQNRLVKRLEYEIGLGLLNLVPQAV